MTISGPGVGTVWVTGAGGFIGRHLSRKLATLGFGVAGFGNRDAPDFGALTGGTFFSGGITTSSLKTAIAARGIPAAVYHLAGGGTVGQSIDDPMGDFSSTVATTAALLDVLRRVAPDAPVVIASSAAVYGAGHDGPIPVRSPLRPFSPYGHHKRMVEQLGESFATTYGQPVSVVRLFSVYGEGLRKQLPFDLCSRLGRGETEILLGGTGMEKRDWHHASDIVELLWRLTPAVGDTFKIYNGGGGATATVREIAEAILRAWKGTASLSFSNNSRPGDPFNLIADDSCLPEDFVWRVPLSSGIPAYVDWFRNDVGLRAS